MSVIKVNRSVLEEKVNSLNTYVDLSFLFLACSVMFSNTYNGKNYYFYAGFFIFIGVTLIKLLARLLVRQTVVIPYITIWMSIFTLFCASSILWSMFPRTTLTVTQPLLQLIAISFCISQHYSTRDGLDRYLKILSITGFLTCIHIFRITPVGEWFDGMLGSTTGQNTNVIGFTLMCTAIITFFIGMDQKSVYYFLMAAFQVSTIVLTGSRKSIVCVGLGIALIVLIAYRKKNVASRMFLVLLAGIAAIYLIMNVPALYDAVGFRFERMFGYFAGTDDDSSISNRMLYIEVAKEAFYLHPILGIGINGFISYMGTTRGLFHYSHNNYYELLSCGGIVGFSLYYSLYVYIVYRAVRLLHTKKPLAALVFSLMTVILLCEYGLVTFYARYFPFFLIIPMLYFSIIDNEHD